MKKHLNLEINLLKRKKDDTLHFERETLFPYTKNMEDWPRIN